MGAVGDGLQLELVNAKTDTYLYYIFPSVHLATSRVLTRRHVWQTSISCNLCVDLFETSCVIFGIEAACYGDGVCLICEHLASSLPAYLDCSASSRS